MKRLTVGLIAGPHRQRARRALDGLLGQTIGDEMLIHVVDFASTNDSIAADHPEVQVTVPPDGILIGGARAEVVRQAETPLVGFLEEHAVAAPDWAQSLMQAHEEPGVAAAAGVIVNLDSEPLLAKVAGLCSYRASLPPLRSCEAEVLFGQNVCYKRSDLTALDDDLDDLLTTELLLFKLLRSNGRSLRVVADARIQHAGLARYLDVLHGVYHYERAAHGLARERGEPSTASDYCRALLSPAARTLKTAVSESRLRGFPLLTLGCLPWAVAIHVAAACGQLTGRLKGPGGSPMSYSRNELVTARTDLPPLPAR